MKHVDGRIYITLEQAEDLVAVCYEYLSDEIRRAKKQNSIIDWDRITRFQKVYRIAVDQRNKLRDRKVNKHLRQ